jgi:uncharacterized membrane protein YeaQ/YmgE (transglycosylase-associated protein family)
MSIETWIIAGLGVGFFASKLVVRTGEGLMRDLGLGVAGAILAGLLFRVLATVEPGGDINVFALAVTVAGAAAALIVYHTLYPHVRPG